SHAGSCQCHESGSLTGWLYKKFAVPLVKRRIKSYIIFIVYLTECTSNPGMTGISLHIDQHTKQ
ncbi:MAG: hypothetical protein MR806_09645, partial [Subdoligranulum sp.]|nr:hypothetical protein [Subdoligranulum sp.]